ncbi:MAG: hypothetical protein PVF17_03645 [Ignavibacteria bacterium]|jgi:hypothetical protein
MKFEIFKTGSHTSDKGVSKDYTLDELNFIAESYNPKEDEAPIVIGHPQDNDPAFGWISSLSVSEDGSLFAEAPDDKLHPDFLAALKEGRYKKRSISLTPEGKLRHVGFLGAAKPSVKGLADIQFSSPSSVVYEFDFDDKSVDKKDDVEDKSKVNNEKISELSQEIIQLKETVSSLQNNFSESELNSTKASIDKINSQLNSLQAKISNSDFEDLLEDKVSEGTLTPAIKDKVIEVSNFMQLQNFSDDFSPAKFQDEVNKLLVSLVNAFPKIIYYENFAEKPDDDLEIKDDSFAGLEVDNESKQLHKKALTLMKKDNISYLSAVTKLINN